MTTHRTPLSLSYGQPERDACGVGFVANVGGERTHDLVAKGIETLIHLEHRGACGCDPESGDGAGLIFHIPARTVPRRSLWLPRESSSPSRRRLTASVR